MNGKNESHMLSPLFSILVIKNEKIVFEFHLRMYESALAGVAQWIECRLRIKGSLVQFPVRAHAWVVAQVPSVGHMRSNHTLMFLSLSFSLPSPLS